jgi:methyl-accepting chemotaxis protein
MPDPIIVTAEHQTSAKKHVWTMLNIRNWSIAWKVRLNFFLRAVVAIGLMVSMISLFQRRITLKENQDKLLLVVETQSRYIEDYFGHLEQQLQNFSADRATIEAFNQLSNAFLNIENEDYLTATVTSPDKMNVLLEGFYTAEVLPALNASSATEVNLKTLVPADSKQRIMQYLYLADNSRPLGSKGILNKAADGSNYSFLHAQYHPGMLKYAREAGISDILFVDYKSGYVTYSAKKNLDFATNLFEGPYKSSGLGMAFKTAIAQASGETVSLTDASQYVPALLKPYVFMSAPVYSGSQLLGAVVFSLSTDDLNNLLQLDKENTTAAKSLKTVMVGPDLLYRNDDPAFLADPERYLKKLKRNASNGNTAAEAKKLGTTALIQTVDPLAFNKALQGKADITQFISETGETLLCTYKPLHISHLNWILVALMDKSEALSIARRFTLIFFGIALLIACILYYMSSVTSNAITGRLIRLKTTILDLAKGEKLEEPELDSSDEIGLSMVALAKLSTRMREATVFISEVSNGNIESEFTVISETDRYGIALSNLKKSLALKREEEEKRRKEDEIRNWTTHGIAMFNDILRTDNNDLEKLSLNIVRNIIEYVSASQGGLFLIEEGEGQQHLNLIASYAYDRQKFLKKKIAIGEGLAGNCVLEKKTVLLKKIPDNYIEISSGLGKSKPGCLIIVPLKKEDDVLGVLELASFNDFRPHEVEFLEKVAESIAASLITVRLHEQTSQYLERFRQQAEEMKAQDEELRQNIEELQATHEQMERLKLEENERNEKMIRGMEDYRKLLISVLNEVPEKIFLKDDKGRFVIANKLVAENYNKTVEEILGKSDFDFYPKKEAEKYFKNEQDIIQSGQTQSFEEGDPTRYDKMIVRSIKKPFYIEHLGITGLFGVQFDISDIKRKEYEATKLAEELESKQKELHLSRILLIDVLNKIPAKVFLKDENGVFVVVNNAVASVYDKKPEQIIGTSDYDNHPDEDVDSWRKQELEIINKGETTYLHKESLQGKTSFLKTTKMPFMLATTGKTGLLGIQFDVTDLKILEEEVHNLKAQVEQLKK